MKHPYQNIVSSETHLFISVQNHIQAFDLDGKLVGQWTDQIGNADILKKQQLDKISKLESETKRSETNDKVKIPKIPTPGPGAPPLYNYIRSLQLTKDKKHLIGITDSDKSVIIFTINLTKDNILTLIKRQNFPKRPCSISVAEDNSTVIVGDKFGDVYKIVIDEETPINETKLKPILGHVSMLTEVLIINNDGKQFILSSDRDEHIKVSNYPLTYVVEHWLFGHDEFISSMIQLDFDKKLLVSGGGDDSIYYWNWLENKLIDQFNVRELIEPFLTEFHLPPERFLNENSKKEISVTKIIQVDKTLIVLFEKVPALLLLNINEDNLEFNEILTLDHSLTDLSFNGQLLIGSVESHDNKLLQKFEVKDRKLSVVPQDFSNIIDANPCEVESEREWYPLFTINTLRKRSEH